MGITVELVPFLERLRELYTHPRGFARFQEYLELLRSQTGEMELPISNVNPMAKPHALERVEQLIALGAERVAFEAAREAGVRLDGQDALRLIVIVIDDAAGGWTTRWFTQFAHRYERQHEVRRGWVTVPCWSSEEPSAGTIARESAAAFYRTVDERRNGPVRTLRDILAREIRAQRFAGCESPYESAAYRSSAQAYLDSSDAPVVIAALYGDEAAATLGYPPLGVLEKEVPGFRCWSARPSRIRHSVAIPEVIVDRTPGAML
jgi:hypothetical protein